MNAALGSTLRIAAPAVLVAVVYVLFFLPGAAREAETAEAAEWTARAAAPSPDRISAVREQIAETDAEIERLTKAQVERTSASAGSDPDALARAFAEACTRRRVRLVEEGPADPASVPSLPPTVARSLGRGTGGAAPARRLRAIRAEGAYLDVLALLTDLGREHPQIVVLRFSMTTSADSRSPSWSFVLWT